MDQPETESLSLELWTVMSRARASVARHAEADIGRHGISPGEFAVLEALQRSGPMLLGDIQRKALVSSGGVTYLVDKLERKGLVARRMCDHDRRACYAALTDEGELRMRQIAPEHAALLESALTGLDDSEKRTAIALLRNIELSATLGSEES